MEEKCLRKFKLYLTKQVQEKQFQQLRTNLLEIINFSTYKQVTGYFAEFKDTALFKRLWDQFNIYKPLTDPVQNPTEDWNFEIAISQCCQSSISQHMVLNKKLLDSLPTFGFLVFGVRLRSKKEIDSTADNIWFEGSSVFHMTENYYNYDDSLKLLRTHKGVLRRPFGIIISGDKPTVQQFKTLAHLNEPVVTVVSKTRLEIISYNHHQLQLWSVTKSQEPNLIQVRTPAAFTQSHSEIIFLSKQTVFHRFSKNGITTDDPTIVDMGPGFYYKLSTGLLRVIRMDVGALAPEDRVLHYVRYFQMNNLHLLREECFEAEKSASQYPIIPFIRTNSFDHQVPMNVLQVFFNCKQAAGNQYLFIVASPEVPGKYSVSICSFRSNLTLTDLQNAEAPRFGQLNQNKILQEVFRVGQDNITLFFQEGRMEEVMELNFKRM